MKRQLTSLLAFLAFSLAGANAWASPFSSLYAFGDSLSDSGNNPSSVLSIYNLIGGTCDSFHPCPPYFNGRYSNGPVAVEYLANAVLPGGGTPANFHNFAVSGATTGIGNFGDGGSALAPGLYGLPGMYQEIGLYLSSVSGVADPNALYFVWGGANDFLTFNSPILAAQNIAGYVGALAAAGAEHLLVPNLPDLGLTPFVRSVGPDFVAAAHAFSVGFNAELALRLGELSLLFPAADIVDFDTFSFLNDVVLNPAGYGFGNSQDACLPSLDATPCANPDDYVFWDGFHPTTRADALIALAFARAVPEPGTIALLMLGLLALSAGGYHRRQHAGVCSRK
ncbi:MAG: SGNH/GDSL hydrolase family protein [Rhodocyclaceae bacterium]|jgi:phospholipase/lecithinase/hemolysin|nr:SGNH/GDSL hydrolase family protein [Rhodocyclaceae bacterium]